MRFSDKSINFRTLLQKYQKEGSCTFVTVAAQSSIHRRTDLKILLLSFSNIVRPFHLRHVINFRSRIGSPNPVSSAARVLLEAGWQLVVALVFR